MTNDSCECKVGRSAKAHAVRNLNSTLRRRYVEEDDSLRSLSEYVNVSILESALERTDFDVVGDGKSIYEALVGDDVAPERRADVTDQLEYAGIDVEGLTDDFVSHQTVKTHLNECLKLDTSRKGVESLEDGRRVIEWARERDEHIITQTVEQLQRADVIDSGQLDVTHSVTVRCTDCDETFRLNELLDDATCSCASRD